MGFGAALIAAPLEGRVGGITQQLIYFHPNIFREAEILTWTEIQTTRKYERVTPVVWDGIIQSIFDI